MQQVFRMVNVWLQHDVEAKKRRLTVQTYRIVPLSQEAGVLEWCQDTVPLGVWLVGAGGAGIGAHARYRPQNSKAKDCRARMAAQAARGKDGLLETFQSVCNTFQPVMR